MTDHYRTIYVVEPSHDLTALKPYTDNIELLTSGYENVFDLAEKIQRNLASFDPKLDAIVPIGKLISTMLTGMVLRELVGNQPVRIGMYHNKDYEFIAIGAPDATG